MPITVEMIKPGMIVSGKGHNPGCSYTGTVVGLYPQYGLIEIDVDKGYNIFITASSATVEIR